eukprot:JP446836.1.p1 GENE.JP446836.1~~JP446836.1.p1  ORF type:complete len:237 (+),score=8.50 JP446836.1:24-713(+)
MKTVLALSLLLLLCSSAVSTPQEYLDSVDLQGDGLYGEDILNAVYAEEDLDSVGLQGDGLYGEDILNDNDFDVHDNDLQTEDSSLGVFEGKFRASLAAKGLGGPCSKSACRILSRIIEREQLENIRQLCTRDFSYEDVYCFVKNVQGDLGYHSNFCRLRWAFFGAKLEIPYSSSNPCNRLGRYLHKAFTEIDAADNSGEVASAADASELAIQASEQDLDHLLDYGKMCT